MGKLIKYEFRNSRKSIFQLIWLIGIASLVLQIIFNGFTRLQINNVEITGAMSVVATLAGFASIGGMFLIFGTFIAFYLRLANILKTDIYQNRGYITFSLPKSGYQILGAKLIVAFIWTIILPVVIFIWNALIFAVLWILIPGIVVPSEISMIVSQIWEGVKEIFANLNFMYFISTIVSSISSSVFYMLVMFAAVIVDYKVGIRKKDSARWIIFALLFLIFWAVLTSQLFGTMGLNIPYDYMYGTNNMEIIRTHFSNLTNTQLISATFNALSSVLLFIFVGYNIEKKIEK